MRGSRSSLRLRAARNGRSVEDEVRNILREAAEALARDPTVAPVRRHADPVAAHATAPAPAGAKRVLLIIGGGIAAYKSLDLIRRLKERGVAVRCILTKAGAAVRHAAVGRRARRRARVHRSVRPGERIRRRPYPARARDRSDRRRAGDRRPDGEDRRAAMPTISPPPCCWRPTAKILLAPAMNPRMWANKATQRNLAQLAADGVAWSARMKARWRKRRARPRPHGRAAGDRRRGRETCW